MLGIQILITIFAAVAIARAFSGLRRGSLKRSWALVWVLFWIGVVVVVFLPQTTQALANVLGVGRGVDVVTYISIAVLFFLIFRLFVKIESVEQEISMLVRKLALDEHKKDE